MPSVPCPNPLTWPKIPLVQTSSSPAAVSPVSLLRTREAGFSILAPIYLLGTCAWAVFKVSNRSFFTSLPPFLSLLFFLSTAGPCSSLRVLLDVPSLEELSWAPVTMSGCQSPLQGSENPPVCFPSQLCCAVFPWPVHVSLSVASSKVSIAGTKLALRTYQHYPVLGTQEVLNTLSLMKEGRLW